MVFVKNDPLWHAKLWIVHSDDFVSKFLNGRKAQQRNSHLQFLWKYPLFGSPPRFDWELITAMRTSIYATHSTTAPHTAELALRWKQSTEVRIKKRKWENDQEKKKVFLFFLVERACFFLLSCFLFLNSHALACLKILKDPIVVDANNLVRKVFMI